MADNFDKLKKVVWSGTLEEAEQRDIEYWRSKTPYYRLRALEHLRQSVHGYGKGKSVPRVQRVFRVIEQGED